MRDYADREYLTELMENDSPNGFFVGFLNVVIGYAIVALCLCAVTYFWG